MAKICDTLSDCINYINFLYEVDSTAPTAGDEDYTVWTGLLNVAKNLWENEEGVLWRELFVKLADAATGDKTTDGTTSYTCPTDFVFPASAYVWIGTVPYKVIKIEDLQLYENDTGEWCYFVTGASPTLEFNPNLTMDTGSTISYNYYKYATKLTTGTDKIEMSDPMAAVMFVVGELKKEEGDASALEVYTQKVKAMATKNEMPTWLQDNDLLNPTETGFGV
jgi:hypothetical protein